METKYYHAANASGLIGGIKFTGYGIFGGCLFGVFAANDVALVSKLDALAQSPSSGVTAIHQSEYEDCLKKKTLGLEPSPASKPQSQPAGPIKGTVAAIVVSEPLPPAEEKSEINMSSAPLESVEAAIRVEEVKGRKP